MIFYNTLTIEPWRTALTGSWVHWQPAIVIICAISVYWQQTLSIAVMPLPCREAILTFWNTVCESAVTSSSGLPVRLWLLYSFQPNRLSRVTTTASSVCFFINVGQQSYLLLFGIPSPTHSFIPGLKPSFFCKSFPPQPFFFFFRAYYMDSPDCLGLLLLPSISVFFTF